MVGEWEEGGREEWGEGERKGGVGRGREEGGVGEGERSVGREG